MNRAPDASKAARDVRLALDHLAEAMATLEYADAARAIAPAWHAVARETLDGAHAAALGFLRAVEGGL